MSANPRARTALVLTFFFFFFFEGEGATTKDNKVCEPLHLDDSKLHLDDSKVCEPLEP